MDCSIGFLFPAIFFFLPVSLRGREGWMLLCEGWMLL